VQRDDTANRQTIIFFEISIEAGILLGGKHEARVVLWGWQELNPCRPDKIGRETAFALS
jgi:hypothetical protein